VRTKPYELLTPKVTAWAMTDKNGRIITESVTACDMNGVRRFVEVVILTEFDYHKLTERIPAPPPDEEEMR
jgi:hypothetical protein